MWSWINLKNIDVYNEEFQSRMNIIERELTREYFPRITSWSRRVRVFPLKDLFLSLHLYKLLYRLEFINSTLLNFDCKLLASNESLVKEESRVYSEEPFLISLKLKKNIGKNELLVITRCSTYSDVECIVNKYIKSIYIAINKIFYTILGSTHRRT